MAGCWLAPMADHGGRVPPTRLGGTLAARELHHCPRRKIDNCIFNGRRAWIAASEIKVISKYKKMKMIRLWPPAAGFRFFFRGQTLAVKDQSDTTHALIIASTWLPINDRLCYFTHNQSFGAGSRQEKPNFPFGWKKRKKENE